MSTLEDDGGPAEYWLSSPRYVTLYGEKQPRYVEASPSNQKSVKLSANVPAMEKGEQKGWQPRKEDPFCRRSKQQKPAPAHAPQAKQPVTAANKQPKRHPADPQPPSPSLEPPAPPEEVTPPAAPSGRAADRP